VAGAFPSVPLWYLRYILDGKGATEQTMRFYELADGSGRFCMKSGGGYSKWAPKSRIGVGQGEKGSPEKYCIIIDPLLEYLAHFQDSGLEIGPGQDIQIPGGIPIVMNDRLVAVLFCDDMFVVSGSAEGLQRLLYKAGEVYDFAGARQVA
jgi:hypothetical protein